MRKNAISFIFTVQLSRNQRFSASFHHSVETLVNLIMPHITQKYKDNLDAARNANHSLAVFVKVCSRCLSHLFPGPIFKDRFCPLVAMFQPDGQRVRFQTNQQLHELFHAWRPEGRPATRWKLSWFRTPADASLSSAFCFYFLFIPDAVWVQVWVLACCLQPWALCPSEPAHAVRKGANPEISRWEDQFWPDGGCSHK